MSDNHIDFVDESIQKAHLEVKEENDPFSPQNLPILQFITTARLLDVAMALLTEKNPEAANDLLELHSEGNLVYTAPSFNGQFIADIVASLDEAPAGEENSKTS